MSAGEAWERIVRVALLGTERQPAAEDAGTDDPSLDGAVAALADRPAEARLLGTAALLDAWRRAGRRAPRTAVRPAEPAPESAARPCSPLAARVLRQLLAGGPPVLVAEWMTLAAAAGVGILPEMLPEVLDFARRNLHVRDAISRMLGARGAWLAALNPAWAFAAGIGEDPAAAWETGTAEERVRILRHLRASDPAAALALLQTTWDAEPPAERTRFVEALGVGLGMDDEPFLEAALDDKRKEVRAAAAQLLATLPASRLVKRMMERLLPLFTRREPEGLVARIRNARPRFDVRMPEKCDRGMRRDGIDDRPRTGIGPRGWMLRQMIGAVPPSLWTAHWGMDAAAFLDAVRAGMEPEEWATLVPGWTHAALHNRDVEWAEALMRPQSGGVDGITGLAPLLPAERLEALALERLREGHLTGNQPAALLLEAAAHPWSPALTRAALGAVPAALSDRERVVLASWLSVYALFMHPATAVAVLREQGDPHAGPWVDLLHLRHTLHQAFE